LRRGLDLDGKAYAVLTLHRPSNVDNADHLRRTLEAIAELAQSIPVVFPAHPRTARNIEAAGGLHGLNTWNGGPLPGHGLWMMPPASYLDFLDLIRHAVLVITDSGGVQEETTYLGVPCLTYRESTERPVTVSMGTNRVVGCDPNQLMVSALEALKSAHSQPRSAPVCPPLWDGRTASRIVAILKQVWQSEAACAGERVPL
jgi:UDP-N-acetylglucosamine 2-epimerase (non-hydrolysing)